MSRGSICGRVFKIMDFSEPDRSTYLTVIQELYGPGAQISLGPTQAQLETVFLQLKDAVEKYGSAKFIQAYLELLKSSQISLLDPSIFLRSSREIQKLFEPIINEFYQKFIEAHPEIFTKLPEETKANLADNLWKACFYIPERDSTTESEYWNAYHKISTEFYQKHLAKLSEKELLSGLKWCHSGHEEGFSQTDVETLLSFLSRST